mgnify:CR=1 FL=1
MLTNEALQLEFDKFKTSPHPKFIWRYSVEIITESDTIKANRLHSYVIEADYAGVTQGNAPFSDRVAISVEVGRSTYRDKIYPFREKLRVRVIRTRTTGQNTDTEGEVLTRLFDAQLVNPVDLSALAARRENVDKAEEEGMNFIDIQFQLSDPSVIGCLMSKVGGIFRDVTQKDLLQGLMGVGLTPSSNPSTLKSETYTGVRGVNIVEPTNIKRYTQVWINPTTRLVDLPMALQKEYGVYSSGLGYYLTNGHWFIYPLRDYNAFNVTEKTLTILNIPKQEGIGVDKTYRVEGKKVFILAGNRTEMKDVANDAFLNVGNGIRYVRASSLLDDLHETSENKTTMRKSDTVKQYLIYESPEGRNNIQYPENILTDNPYPLLSDMSAGLGRMVMVDWLEADPQLLYPGMPVRFLYSKDGKVVTLDGTLFAAKSVTMASDKVSNQEARTSVSMVIYVKEVEG